MLQSTAGQFVLRHPIVLLACAISVASAQSGQLTLSGSILNSKTGEPVKRALVQVTSYRAPKPVAPGERVLPPAPFVGTTFTDASGLFRFSALEPGHYTISASKPEFQVSADNVQNLQVELSSSKNDLQLKLSPLGVISGKVVDQGGQPLRGVNVIALTMQMEDGWRRTRSDRSVSTDDRGIYRLWNLQPGKYYIKAAGQTAATYSYVGEVTPQFFADESFAPAYFGGGKTLDAASPIEIEQGSEAHADITLKLQQAYKIRGALVSYVPHRTVKFELLAGDESVAAGRVSVNTDTGRFEMQDVVDGSYLLRATQDQNSGTVAVNVNGIDLNGISLTLFPPVDVKGSIRYTNPAQAPAVSTGAIRRGRRSACNITLHPVGRRAGPQYNSQEGESGEFTVKQVIPDSYRIGVRCGGAYAVSVMSGSQDLLAQPTLLVPPGAGPPPIEVAATFGGGTIQGTVSAGEKGGRRTDVLVVPQFPGAGPVLLGAFRQGGAGPWQFFVPSLAPGAYVLYAFSENAEVEFRNPQFLQSLRGGTRVDVTDQGTVQATITEILP